MPNFCLTKEQIDILKPKMREVGGVKLVTMSSSERASFFTEAMGSPIVGKEMASSFEQAIISKQKNALKNWAKTVFTVKEQTAETYKDVIAKIDRLSKEGVLSPTSTNEYLENLVATSLGVDLKPEEIKKINELSKKVDEASRMPEDNPFGIPNIEYFKAREEMNNYLQSISPASAFELLSGVIGRGNLLASIKSPVTNVISNISGLMTEPLVRRAVARKFSGVNSDLVGPFIKHAYKVYNETGYDVVRMLQLQDDQKTLGEGRTTTQGEGKVRKLARIYEDLIFKKAMGTPDVIAAAIHFADSLNVNASKMADAEGYTGEEHKKRATELFKNATSLHPTEAGQATALREQAISDALYATYQDKSWLADMALKIRNLLDDATGSLKLGTNLEPFVKTPANVVKTSLEYSGYTLPAVVIKLPSAIHEAQNGKPEQLQQLSRTAVRAGIGLSVALLIVSMLDDGDYIPDYVNASPRQRELVKLSNASYNSIKIGDKWVSLDYFGVLGAAIAGFAGASQKNGAGNKSLGFAEASFAQIQRIPVLSKIFDTYAFFQDVKDYNKTPDEIAGAMAGSLIQNIYSRSVPMIVADIAKATDSSQRLDDYKTPWDNIQAEIPWLREALPEKYNDLGQVIPTENAAFTMLFGARVKTATKSEVLNEIRALEDKGISVTMNTSRVAEMEAAKAIMTPEEYNDFHAEVQKNIATVYNKIINTNTYKNADPTEKETMLEESRKKIVQTTARNKGYYSRIRAHINEDKKAKKLEKKNKGK